MVKYDLTYINLPIYFIPAFVNDDKTDFTEEDEIEFNATLEELKTTFPNGYELGAINDYDTWLDRPDMGVKRLASHICTFEFSHPL